MIKLLPILLIFLFSCKTSKQVTKIETKYDSTAIKENVALRRFLSEEIERFEKEREAWENTGVTFFPEGFPAGTDTTGKINWTTKISDPPYTVPAKITFENGKIKSIEGRVKSLNQNLHEKSSELLDAHKTIDILQYELEKKQVNIKKEITTIHKNTKTKITVWPIWLFVICLVGGLLIEYEYKIIKQILSLKLKL